VKKFALFMTVIVLFGVLGAEATATEKFPEEYVMELNTQDSLVQTVQTQLQQLGYLDEAATGLYGEATAKAVRKFQMVHEMSQDGKVGPATYDLLFSPQAISYQKYVEDIEARGGVLKIGSEGEAVINLQMRLRDLGYFNYKVTGYYGDATRASVSTFQDENALAVDGTIGPDTSEYLYSSDAKRKLVLATAATDYLTASRGGTSSLGTLVEWFSQGQYIFRRGDIATVTDLYTGRTFSMKRTGGTNHADSEPVSSADAAVIKSIWGGWSWTRRPIIVEIHGLKIAASMHGMPHAYDRIGNNGMTGHVCIHFYKSRTHVNNKQCPQHQRCVLIAAGKN
jgi:peptidoglycan hydrolase-like protein with peptidoglycan-binding domain